jgi:hypothetical protein
MALFINQDEPESRAPNYACVRFLCLDERQHPVFQAQMHVRRRVPFLKIVPMDAVLAKLGIAKPQLFFSQVTHLLTPIAVRRSAANYECFHNPLIARRQKLHNLFLVVRSGNFSSIHSKAE